MAALRNDDSTPVSILVVERDVELRSYLVDALTTLTPDPPVVLEAEDVAAAATVIGGTSVDLVLATLDPPDGGRSLCVELGVGDTGQVPVLLIGTGTSSSITNRDVRSLAATTLLRGSLNATRLCATVRRILGQRPR